jgi:general stress protein 26
LAKPIKDASKKALTVARGHVGCNFRSMTQSVALQAKTPETVSHLVSLLRDFEAATLITRQRGGSLHGRPMAIARVDDNVTLWFVTSIASAKVEEIAEDSRAMVTFQSASRCVCLNGNAELVFDPTQIKALWKDEYRVWCQSETDPDLVLVRFHAFDAEYWDNAGANGLKYAFESSPTQLSGQKLDRRAPLKSTRESHARLKLWEPSEPDASE